MCYVLVKTQMEEERIKPGSWSEHLNDNLLHCTQGSLIISKGGTGFREEVYIGTYVICRPCRLFMD